jgi:8-oxo-dGTP diphosphatase
LRHIVNALLTRDRTVLLARRGPHRVAYPNRWSFPGGHVEVGETLDEALTRELREEIGVTPAKCEFLGTIPDPTSEATYHLYAVTAWAGGEPAMTGDEHTALHWFAIDAAAMLPELALEEYRPIFGKLPG